MSYTSYYRGGWKSGRDGGTPITPEALNHMEEGIAGTLKFQGTLTSEDDLNDITDSGVYVYTASNIPNNAPFDGATIVAVFGSNSTSSQKIQVAFRYGTAGYFKFRSLYSNAWNDWTRTALLSDENRLTASTVQESEHIFGDEIDNAKKSGWYRVSSSDGSLISFGSLSTEYAVLRVDAYADTYGVQTVYPTASSLNLVLRRIFVGDTWTEWEWENPPMKFDVEYRTTDRYDGKAVYKKAIDFGALPNNTSKTVSTGLGSVTMISVTATAHSTENTAVNPFPFISSAGTLLGKVQYSASGVTIYTFSDISNYTAVVTLTYTK